MELNDLYFSQTSQPAAHLPLGTLQITLLYTIQMPLRMADTQHGSME